eukprot:CAMPEP_0114255106 /NCGR_PEP_ID=MMETSP0058-20121206/17372_1 /TAXON_ID=36894 /ORGANISM="Pyramimonas parkeae, CCMP726" /LENGTH=132 /DNA_ID=CAMNT_0001369443 /DNA_START=73 /DNA_END=468 /DNA_ORIENTATION=-
MASCIRTPITSRTLKDRRAMRTRVAARPLGRIAVVAQAEKKPDVDYGDDWYTQTKQYSVRKTNSKQFYAKYKAANEAANNGKERKDLYSDAWDGDVYKGKEKVNILTVLIALFIGVPVLGLIFAYQSYGVLW